MVSTLAYRQRRWKLLMLFDGMKEGGRVVGVAGVFVEKVGEKVLIRVGHLGGGRKPQI